jgi:hypothetical protein
MPPGVAEPMRHAGLLLAVFAASHGCEATPLDPAYCGECRTLVEGDVAAAGDLRIDGHLAAAYEVETLATRRRAAFEAAVLHLAAAHGLPAGQVTLEYVEDLLRVIAADGVAHLDGTLRAVVRDSTCTASQAVAADAQARCERAAGCSPGAVVSTFTAACDGRCLGVCDGACTGELACGVTVPPSACDGTCDGTCALAPAGMCGGQCLGTCAGACDRFDAAGACVGRCDGECDGVCWLDPAGPCVGMCHGTCWADPTGEACTPASDCRGRCDGACTGQCQGVMTPPGTANDCEAADACRAQATARSLAAIDCSPALVRFEYDLTPGLDPTAHAAFVTRTELLAATGEQALETAAFFELLVAGRADGVEVVTPPPIERLAAALADALPRALAAGIELPAGREACIEPAVTEGIDRLAKLRTTMEPTRQAQATLVEFLRDHR